jgi:hypothetical protein
MPPGCVPLVINGNEGNQTREGHDLVHDECMDRNKRLWLVLYNSQEIVGPGYTARPIEIGHAMDDENIQGQYRQRVTEDKTGVGGTNMQA